VRDANVSRPAHTSRLTRYAALLRCGGLWLGFYAAAGCTEEPKPGVLIELRVEQEEYRPQLVVFDWIVPGRVLLRGQLPARPNASDPSFFATLFIETRGPLTEARVIALRGLRDGLIVSGSVGVFQPSFQDIQSSRISLGAPLFDGNDDGVPDIIERCIDTETGARCLEPPDAAAASYPDAPDRGEPSRSGSAADGGG
jgi:hypothetical protein